MDTINNDTKMEETVKGSHKWEPPFRAIRDLWSNDKTVEQLHSQTLKCKMLFPYIFRLLIWPGVRLTLRLLQCFLKGFYILHSRYNLFYLSVHRWEFDIIPCSSKL